jgi:hypothetical protein
MTWSKFDDLYDEHEKVEDAWEQERATVGLHVQATTHCNRLLTDGVIQPRWINRKLPERRERERVLAVMLATGLFDLLPAGETRVIVTKTGEQVTLGPFGEDRYVVHDFLDRHDSKATVMARREAESARKRAARSKRSPDGQAPGGRADSSRTAAGIQAESGDPPARVIPTRPDPTETRTPPHPPASGGRKRALVSFEDSAVTWAAAAGVTGDRQGVLRAYGQAAPWKSPDPCPEFRAFVGRLFPSLTVEEPMGEVRPLPERDAA